MDFIRMICLAAFALEIGIVLGGFIPALAAQIGRFEDGIMMMFGVVSIALAIMVVGARHAMKPLRKSRISLAGQSRHEQPDIAISA